MEGVAGQLTILFNDDDLLELHRQLLSIWPTEFADFVIAMRQYGPGQPIAAASFRAQIAVR